jgi:hypothetical protein
MMTSYDPRHDLVQLDTAGSAGHSTSSDCHQSVLYVLCMKLRLRQEQRYEHPHLLWLLVAAHCRRCPEQAEKAPMVRTRHRPFAESSYHYFVELVSDSCS